MKIQGRLIALLAACLSAAQPCVAAELASHDGARQSGAYGGLYFRVPLSGERKPEEPRAGLKLGMSHVYRGSSAVTGERRIEAGLVDVGMFTSGKPSLMLGGRQLVDEKGRLSLQNDDEDKDGGVSPWLIGAGVLVLALGVGILLFDDAMDDASE